MDATIRTKVDLDRLLSSKVPEGQSIEYKQEMVLKAASDRREALKDLTAMGNGGGGTVIVGVAKSEDEPELPGGLSAIWDRSLPGVLEDIARNGVRPPLLYEMRTIDADGGFVLVVEITPSPLGPYMVQGYGENRYHARHGSRSSPMTEQEVRDAYLISTRGRDQRPEEWEQHQLPIRMPWARPTVTISGLPEGPLSDVIDLASAAPSEFALPDHLQAMPYSRPADLDGLTGQLRLWLNGLFADDPFGGDPPSRFLRLHRDGAAGYAASFQGPQVYPYTIARVMNAVLAYMGWVWGRIGLRSPIELRLVLDRLEGTHFFPPRANATAQQLATPLTATVDSVSMARQALPGHIERASLRHGIIRDFTDRVHQAYGTPRADGLFRVGWLYGRDGRSLGLSIAGRGIWSQTGEQRGFVDTSNVIRNYWNQDKIIGFFLDGVIVDESGRAMATLEMACGPGLPDSFKIVEVVEGILPFVPGGNPGVPLEPRESVAPPSPIGEWSDRNLNTEVINYQA